MAKSNNAIDFVLIWVDDADPLWRAEKEKYAQKHSDAFGIIDDSAARYKDWQNLKYWFRGVERFAPWVHKVFFVTCGHVPDWLNLKAEKIIHIKHSDYMPSQYLPTFNSHPIELNLHRINGLSEQFVYFNDDTFLIRPVKDTFFFKKGLPIHPARIHGILPRGDSGIMSHVYVNMIETINRHFDYHMCIAKNRSKWLNPFVNDVKDVIENLYNLGYEQFPGIGNEHLPVPILKKTMKEVWDYEYELLDKTSRHRFRSEQDVSQFIFRYWQLASGRFYPINRNKLGGRITIQQENNQILDIIENQKWPMLCINDMGRTKEEEFNKIKERINGAFEKILPEKSSFEL